MLAQPRAQTPGEDRSLEGTGMGSRAGEGLEWQRHLEKPPGPGPSYLSQAEAK